MRELHTARLTRKQLLSEPAQCFHLAFQTDAPLIFDPGQFLSLVATDKNGKQQTRAYSLASAPREGSFDLCVNRVEGGFFSNLLCDLTEGETVDFHGPHGYFKLHSPLPHCLLVATDTGIAPMRSFLEWLFPADPQESSDRSAGRQITLLYGAEQPSELYYDGFFEQLEETYTNFHYLPVLAGEDEAWTGLRGSVPEHLPPADPLPDAGQASQAVGTQVFQAQAYICGLNALVAPAREHLRSLGWARKQIAFERYD